MDANTTYRALMRAGLWDLALDVLPPDSTAARAEILTDAFWWRLEGASRAEEAVIELADIDPVRAGFHAAQLAYTRTLFGIDPRPGDTDRAREGFTVATADAGLAGWAVLWLGVVAEHLDQARMRASEQYTRALAAARENHDPLLESYAIRHLGGLVIEDGDMGGLEWLRRSYYLRAALGARPQTAAAAATLAAYLPDGPEADQLRETAMGAAAELGLRWLME